MRRPDIRALLEFCLAPALAEQLLRAESSVTLSVQDLVNAEQAA